MPRSLGAFARRSPAGIVHVLLSQRVPGLHLTRGLPRDACLKAVEELHKAGIHHGDLRPPNMILGDDRSMIIIDFNRSRRAVAPEELESEYVQFVHDLERGQDGAVEGGETAEDE
ncbi:hypothetical protein JCM10295v2_007176 [Rhodotorula toruloides]